MLSSGVETSHQTVAPSAAVTDDGQSVRQPNTNLTVNGAASEALTTSCRNVATADRSTAASQRRGNLVLFVRSNDNESDGQPRATSNTSMQSQANGGSSSDSSKTDKEEGEEGEQEDLLSLVVSTATRGGSSALTTVAGAARKPLLTAAIVLLYLILLDIVMLKDNERLNRILRRIRATNNDALVLLSSSLVRQLKDAKKDLYDILAQNNSMATLERLEAVQHRALALERVCNRSIARLHTQLFFPGSVEDLAFLIEEHVAYDAQLQQLAAEELDWVRTVTSLSVVRLSDDVPEGQRSVLGSHAASYGTAGGVSDGGSEGVESEGPAEAAETVSKPLRHVLLERVKSPSSSGAVTRGSAQWKSRLARAASAAAALRPRRRTADKGTGALLEEEEATTGGLLMLLKNRFVAFVVMCVLLAAVLRMG